VKKTQSFTHEHEQKVGNPAKEFNKDIVLKQYGRFCMTYLDASACRDGTLDLRGAIQAESSTKPETSYHPSCSIAACSGASDTRINPR
jgi:hypothetical protein